jgi:uncharacterized membrane protein YphA (DoxX/SURF4 family)
MSITAPIPFWQSTAILVVRLIFAGVFAMAASFKFLGMEGTAGDIASAGFPFPSSWPGFVPAIHACRAATAS